MKKIFTTILLMAAAAAAPATYAFADEPQKVLVALGADEAPLNLTGIDLKEAKVKSYSTIAHEVVAKTAADGELDSDTWTSLGEGKFRENVFSKLYGYSDGPYAVVVEQSNEHPEYYRMVNPYGSLWSYYDNGALMVEDIDSYIIFNTADAGNVSLYTTSGTVSNGTNTYNKQSLNVQSPDGSSGLLYLVDYGTGGTFANGKIKFDAGALGVFAKTSRWLKDAGTFELWLPGAPDYSIDVDIAYDVWTSNKIPFTIKWGTDVPRATYLCWPTSYYSASTSNCQYVASYGTKLAAAGTYTFNFSTRTAETWGTLLVAGSAADSTLLEGDGDHFFISIHKAAEWKSLGKAKFNDDTFAPTLLDDATPLLTRDVELLQNISDPRRYRLVNAFASNSSENFSSSMFHSASTYYTEFIVYKNDSITMGLRPTGVKVGDFKVALGSLKPGALDNRTITFPTRGLVVYNQERSGYYANLYGNFSIVIPRYDVTVTVSDGSAPVAGATVTVGDASATTNDSGVALVQVYNLTGTPTVTATYSNGSLTGKAELELVDGQFDYAVSIGLTTALDKVRADEAAGNNAAYDLNGRRVSNPTNGIYVVGGKKTVVKK